MHLNCPFCIHFTSPGSTSLWFACCRNINHETLDAFMCNECGHSRFGNFEVSISGSPSVSYPPVHSQEGMIRAAAFLEQQVEIARSRRTSLANAVK